MFSPMEQYAAQEPFDGIGSKLKKAAKRTVSTVRAAAKAPVSVVRAVAKSPAAFAVAPVLAVNSRVLSKVTSAVTGRAGVSKPAVQSILAGSVPKAVAARSGYVNVGGKMLSTAEYLASKSSGVRGVQSAEAYERMKRASANAGSARAVSIPTVTANNAAEAIPAVSPASVASDPALAQTIAMTGGNTMLPEVAAQAAIAAEAEIPVTSDASGAPATILDAAQSTAASTAAGAPAKGGALTLLAPAGIGFVVAGPIGAVVGLAAGAMLGKKSQTSVSGFGVLDYSSATKDKIALAQAKLKDLGFDAGPIDGLLGPKTKSGVAAFEKSWGIPTDESWADFLASVDVAWRGRPMPEAIVPDSMKIKPKAPVTVPAAQTTIVVGPPASKSPGILSKIDFKNPMVIGGIAAVAIGAVLLLTPSKGRR